MYLIYLMNYEVVLRTISIMVLKVSDLLFDILVDQNVFAPC